MTGQGEEGAFSTAILKLAAQYRWKVYKRRWNPRGRPDVPGWLDLLMLRGGRLLVLELKKEKGGVVSAEQQAWLDAWAEFAAACPESVRVAVVKPSELEMVAGWLR